MVRFDNFRPIGDPRVAEWIKFVTDQMQPKGSTETRAERELRIHREAAEARHSARRKVRLLAAQTEVTDWLNKKPRR